MLKGYEMKSDYSGSMIDERPEYSLYSLSAINLATAFGSILAGAVLLASNLKKVNREDEALQTYIFGFFILILLFFSIILIPNANKIPDALIQLIQVGFIYGFSYYKFNTEFKSHEKKKGKYYSKWRAFGISLLLLPLVLGILFGINFLTEKKVDFGNEQFVYYEFDATKDDAVTLGNYLQKIGFFGSEGPKDVRIGKISNVYTVSFPLVEDAWNDDEIIFLFTQLRSELAENVFKGATVEIKLCNVFNIPKKTIKE